MIELYHGTSVKNAKEILANGFKDRIASGVKNWDKEFESMAGFVYLTRAYPFFYAMNAAEEEDETTAVLKVIVDEDDLYPDEDFLRSNNVKDADNIAKYKQYGLLSLEKLGNVAIKPEMIVDVIGMKEFKPSEMWRYSDPSMSTLNYMILGGYYRNLTDMWWEGKGISNIDMNDEIVKNFKSDGRNTT